AGAQTNVVVRSRPEEPAPTAKESGATLELPMRVSFNSPALRGLRSASPGLLGDRRDRIDPTAPRLLELHRLAAIGRQPLLKRWHPGSTPFDNLTAPRTTTAPLLSPLLKRWHPGSTPFDNLTAPRTTTAPLLSVHVADSERWGAVVESGLSGGACPCLAVTRPGRVPDGAQVPGLPVRVSRNLAIPPYLDIAWSASCSSSATDYAIYQGQAGSWTSHAPVTCSTGGALAATFAPGSGNRYFLVVPLTTEVEGSYGAAHGQALASRSTPLESAPALPIPQAFCARVR
ncbi:MAG: hypothetical protein MUC67_05080, partial [Acidobacteria bacterium]|nr:hypothetical protein [Acidobacteriota bacterium]